MLRRGCAVSRTAEQREEVVFVAQVVRTPCKGSAALCPGFRVPRSRARLAKETCSLYERGVCSRGAPSFLIGKYRCHGIDPSGRLPGFLPSVASFPSLVCLLVLDTPSHTLIP